MAVLIPSLAAFVVVLVIRFGPRVHTAWVAASTARRVSVWHAENENGRAAEKVDRERADFAAWARELQSHE